jgi:hypothetical protein
MGILSQFAKNILHMTSDETITIALYYLSSKVLNSPFKFWSPVRFYRIERSDAHFSHVEHFL